MSASEELRKLLDDVAAGNITPELAGKVLGCWCAPHACHGDVLVRMVDALRTAEAKRDG